MKPWGGRGGATGAAAKGLVDVETRGLQRRRQAEQDADDEAEDEGEEEHAAVDSHLLETWNVGRRQRDQDAGTRDRNDHTESAGRQRLNGRLDQ